MTHTVSETLDLAADHIEQHGWTQGCNGWGSTKVCIEGAIAAAAGLPTFIDGEGSTAVNECRAGRAVHEHLAATGQRVYHCGLWEWNDEPGRDRLQVIGTLRSAAAAQRAKEQAVVAAAEAASDSFHRSLDAALAVIS